MDSFQIFNPYGETAIFQVNCTNIMAADVLATQVARTSAAMVLSVISMA